MNNELTKELPKRILFFKSQIAAYVRKDGTAVAAHSDKRTKRVSPGKDTHTPDMFARPHTPVPKRDIPVEAAKNPQDFTPDIFTGKTKAESKRKPLEGHPYHDKSGDELRYIIKDAGEAARANPGGRSEGKYLDQVNDASTVMHHRKQNGIVKPLLPRPIVDMAKQRDNADDKDMENMITVAADSIDELRKVDVLRVLESNRRSKPLARYITKNRPDLAKEVKECMEDEFGIEDWMAKSLPILFMKSHVKQFVRKDGTVVKEHDDSRTKKMQAAPVGREPAQQEAPAERKDPEDVRGSAHGYGTHNIEDGDSIKFEAGDFSGKGRVKSVGDDGATVEDGSGRTHNVHWNEVTGFKGAEETKKPDDQRQALGPRDPVEPDKFNASEWKVAHDDANASVESVLKVFPEDTAAKIDAAIKRVTGIEDTQKKFKSDAGDYDQTRESLHDKIMFDGVDKIDEETGERMAGLFANMASCLPADGEKPTFTILGGRGGSGKSQFKGLVYDPGKCIVLDADRIKAMLPEYEGWNAAQVHEESSDILERALEYARDKGLNIVLDATMKTAKSAIAKVEAFKAQGYRTEAHYMHLPRQEAAKRAIARFLGKTARFVPPKIVLENTTNEASFDAIKGMVDSWSFRDNNVKKDEDPILISESKKDAGKGAAGDEKQMQKSIASAIILLWRKKS